jgi:hypothetical protein
MSRLINGSASAAATAESKAKLGELLKERAPLPVPPKFFERAESGEVYAHGVGILPLPVPPKEKGK